MRAPLIRRALLAGLFVASTAAARGEPPPVLVRLGTPPIGEPGESYASPTFSPDGKRLAAVTGPGTAVVWDLETGKALVRMDAPLPNRDLDHALWGRFTEAKLSAFSADGKTLVTGLHQGPFLAWDARTGKKLRRLEKDEGVYFTLAAAGDSFAALTADGQVMLWDVPTGKRLRTWRVAGGESLAFAPDGKTLASGDHDGVIRLWDAATGREVRAFDRAHLGKVSCLAFSPDGKILAEGDPDSDIILWDAAAAKRIRVWQMDPPEGGPEKYGILSLAFSADGKTLASGSRRREAILDLWETSTGKRLHRFEGNVDPSCGCAFSPDGARVATGGGSRINVWDTSTGRPFPPGHTQLIEALAFAADGRRVTTATGTGETKVWDAATGKELAALDPGFYPPLLSGDGSAVADAPDWAAGAARVLETATGRELHAPPAANGTSAGRVLPFALSRDGGLLAYYSAARLVVWDVGAGRERCKPANRISLGGIGFSPDGTLLAAGGGVTSPVRRDERLPSPRDFACQIWDAKTGEEVRSFRLEDDTIAVVFSPDNRLLATAGDEGLYLWETNTGRRRLRIAGGTSRFRPIAFSPDGRTLAVGERTGARVSRSLRLWDVYTGKDVCSLTDYSGGVNALAFSPDGRRLAIAQNDSTAVILDMSGVLDAKARPPVSLPVKERDVWWAKLCGEDGEAAHQAVGLLSRADGDIAAFVAARLAAPGSPPTETAERLERLIADLDSDDFDVREKATRELTSLGGAALPTLKGRVKDRAVSVEAGLRMRRVLAKIVQNQREAPLVPAVWLRGTETLERLGTPEAREALETLGKGDGPAAEMAKASIERLRQTEAAAQK